jgi:hypothetical protein
VPPGAVVVKVAATVGTSAVVPAPDISGEPAVDDGQPQRNWRSVDGDWRGTGLPRVLGLNFLSAARVGTRGARTGPGGEGVRP